MKDKLTAGDALIVLGALVVIASIAVWSPVIAGVLAGAALMAAGWTLN